MTKPGGGGDRALDAPRDALIALAVQLHLDWEAADERAEAARQARERAWAAALAAGAAGGEDLTSPLWRSVERARGDRAATLPGSDAFALLVEEAAAAYLADEAAKERERLAAGRLSTAFAAAQKAMPPGMTRNELQGLYEAARARLRATRGS